MTDDARVRQLEHRIFQLTNPPKQLNIAYILLIFFGVLGVHRFYLGRIGTGIVWLLTFGCLGIGVIVDIFILKSITDKANAEEWARTGSPLPAAY